MSKTHCKNLTLDIPQSTVAPPGTLTSKQIQTSQNKYEEEIIKSVPAEDEEKVEKTEDIKQEHEEIKRPHAQDGEEPLQKKAKHEPETVS